ncbi:MAG TPA: hypothetical protein VM074_03315 [Solimonas sp.]|nr:hypothetical protein [Solimonas sp.]
MIRKLLIALVVLGACRAAYHDWRLRELAQRPGVLVAEEPLQQPVPSGEIRFQLKGYELEALARYHIRARLLGREPYRWDASAKLSPLDFALGWGVMSDSTVLDQLDLEQSSRYFSWRFEGTPPVPPDLLQRSAANTHLIPADDGIAGSLDKMRPGQLVELDGYLVAVSGNDGFRWRSSLVRTDGGAGACEVMYVQSARAI